MIQFSHSLSLSLSFDDIRLFIHVNQSKKLISHQNSIIEDIARKSLICLALTFFVNLAMNLFKVTMFIGVQSDVCIIKLVQKQMKFQRTCLTND